MPPPLLTTTHIHDRVITHQPHTELQQELTTAPSETKQGRVTLLLKPKQGQQTTPPKTRQGRVALLRVLNRKQKLVLRGYIDVKSLMLPNCFLKEFVK